LATQAAEEIYALGGNSVDAAIAASFVLSSSQR
jgi:gamma-glutamyltranspeptidase